MKHSQQDWEGSSPSVSVIAQHIPWSCEEINSSVSLNCFHHPCLWVPESVRDPCSTVFRSATTDTYITAMLVLLGSLILLSIVSDHIGNDGQVKLLRGYRRGWCLIPLASTTTSLCTLNLHRCTLDWVCVIASRCRHLDTIVHGTVLEHLQVRVLCCHTAPTSPSMLRISSHSRASIQMSLLIATYLLSIFELFKFISS